MSEVWTKWQGHVIDGTFPLHRYLGGSDHSGVFLVELGGREPPEVAIKLVPVTVALGEAYLEHWDTAAGLDHPHLVRILQTGRCELDGLPFVYAVMEYSDQNLAQLLEHRAMTEDEAREMLPPMLSALSFLHNRNLVQGQLKPSNILVVGDQVKLASDTICRVSEVTGGVNTVSIYDPPEAGDGRSAAGDIWALGVSLFEALTRSPSLALDVRRGGVVLPSDFSPTFREIVSLCLSRRPYDRPKLSEIEARLRGQVVGSAFEGFAASGEAGGEGTAAYGAGVGGEEAAAVPAELAREAAASAAAVGAVEAGGAASVPAESAREAVASAAGVGAGEEGAASVPAELATEAARPVAAVMSVAAEATSESHAPGTSGAAAAHVTAVGMESASVSTVSESTAAVSAPTASEAAGATSEPVVPPVSQPMPSGEIEAVFSAGEAETIGRTSAAHARPAGATAALAPAVAPVGAGTGPGVGAAGVGSAAKPAAQSRPPSTSTSGTYRAPGGPSTSAGGAPRAPAGASTSASGTYRAPVGPSTSAGGAPRAPAGASTSASGTYRAPVGPSTAASGAGRAPAGAPTATTGANRVPVDPSTSTSGTYRAPAGAATTTTGANRVPVAPSTSTSGTYRAPVNPSTSTSGTYRAPVNPSTSTSGTYRAPVAPSTSTSGTYRAPAGASTSTSGTYRAPVGPAPSARVAGPTAHSAPTPTAGGTPAGGTHSAAPGQQARPAAPAMSAPVNPGSTSTSGIYRSPVAPASAARAQTARATVPAMSVPELPSPPFKSMPSVTVRAAAAAPSELSRAPARSPLSPQGQWTSSEQITVRSPTSEPAVLQRIIGQPVVVMPAAVKRMQAEQMWAEQPQTARGSLEVQAYEAPAYEALSDETETDDDTARPSTQQRYLILLGLVAAVIVPLCWAGLGGLRAHQNKAASIQAPQAAPQQSAAVATPILRNSQEVTPDSVGAAGTVQPGEAAIPASSATTGGQAGVSGSAATGEQVRVSGSAATDDQVRVSGGLATGDQARMSGGLAAGGQAGVSGSTATVADARVSGSAPAVGSLRIPGRVTATDSARVSGSADPFSRSRIPAGRAPAAAAGTSMTASRGADDSYSGGSTDNTNMIADAGGSAAPPGEHEEFPDIPPRIRQTIRGHVKVSVRVIVDGGGSVFAALVDSPGPSRYFEHVAIEAAKKWTFPPADSTSRLKLVRFDFTRDGTTGQAIEVQ